MELNEVLTFNGFAIRHSVFEPAGVNPYALKTLVFVHGTPWNSVVFHPLAKALLATKRYQVLLYDLAGYGMSQTYNDVTTGKNENDLFAGNTSVSQQASALVALFKQSRITSFAEPPAVIAHDIAGAIVLRAHLIHKIQFSCLTLLDTNAVLPWGDGFYKLVRSQPQVFVDMPPHVHEAVVRSVTRSASYKPDTSPKLWEDVLVEPWIGSQDAQRSFVRQIAQADDGDVAEMLDADMYSDVGFDVKILWGHQDQWIPRKKMEQLATLLGGRLKEFVVVPAAGHLVMIDQPERIAVEILSWLEKY